jgi:glycosyltransferase involved in cell wall biosynthesis
MDSQILEGTSIVPDNLPPTVVIDQSLPLFSIVTPSYNQGGFIRESIQSVLQQDYPNIEYWVIDGGSTDETISILQSYEQDPRFHWISEKDRGQSDAINKGLVRCRGDLFSWLNSDDLLAPHALRHVAAAWSAAGHPVLLYGLARSIDAYGVDLGYCATQSSRITLQRLLKLRHTLMQPATFAPTNLVREIGGVNPALHYTMDFDLWVRLAERLPIRHIPHDLAFFRLHPSSKTVAHSDRFINDIAESLYSATQRGLLSKKQARVRTNLFAARTYLTPETRDFSSAIARLKDAIGDEILAAPEAMFILLKALARLVVGEKLWAGVRFVQAKR